MNEKYQYYKEIKFTRDDKTGYYLNSTLRKRMHRYVWEDINGEIPKGCQIHHKDGNKSNNNIENLEIMGTKEHMSYHAYENYSNNKEKVINNINTVRPLTIKWHRSEEGRKWHKEHYKKFKNQLLKQAEYTCIFCGKKFVTECKNTNKFCSNKCKSAWRRKEGLDDETRTCVYCGQKFTINKYSKTKHCSRRCTMLDRHRSESK